MKGRRIQEWLRGLLVIFILSAPWGCAYRTSNGTAIPPSPSEGFNAGKKDTEACLLGPREGLPAPTGEKAPGRQAPLSTKKTDQELIDKAVDLCQLSSEYWDEGDMERALHTLDRAYILITRVNSDAPPELTQQKEDLRFVISKRVIEICGSRHTAAKGYYKAIPLVTNSHVEAAITSFTGREKKFFMESYRRSGVYRPAILKALRDAGLPEELSWLPLIESGFKVRALSRARALGLWQFIASTGYKYGLKRTRWIDERMDPEKSTKAAIAYLKELHDMFGDWTTVLAAYNCGEENVLKLIRGQRINYLDNFWDLYENLPRETAAYVPRFLAVLHILNDPQAFGIELPEVEQPPEIECVTVDRPLDLDTIARHLGICPQTVFELNPELRHHTTPGGPYRLKLPKGKGPVFAARSEEIPTFHLSSASYILHRVKDGDSLYRLACRYKTSVEAIMKVNKLGDGDYLRVGWSLRIPAGVTKAQAL
jgi:membrane-bound lytic murein transglycosylase D